MISTMTVISPENIEVRLEAVMTLGDWKKIYRALSDRQECHHGPIGELKDAIWSLTHSAEKVFYVDTKEKEIPE